MKCLSTGLLFALSITASADSSPTAASPQPIVWKGASRPDLIGYNTEAAPLLSPVDSQSPIDRSAADAPQNVSVEAVPTPTAVASGMLVLGGLALYRLIRRLRLA